jgi:16S rRNA (guanine527-N7)-methyltransferase
LTEEEARAWLQGPGNVSRETLERLEAFAALLRAENKKQNLVAEASLEQLWARHILDSVQLVHLAPDEGRWADLGSGAGFPGLIVGLFRPVTLIEQRKLRASFLEEAAAAMGIAGQVRIVCGNARQAEVGPFDVISARAFAPLPRLLEIGAHLVSERTRWILPKGKNAKSELESALASWQGEFRLEPSITDPDAKIIVAEQVRRRSSSGGARGKR